LLYTVRQVERNGARAVMWSDKICDGRDPPVTADAGMKQLRSSGGNPNLRAGKA